MKPASQSEFRQFVVAQTDRIYNNAFRMLGNREEAEEAVQDILLKVHAGMAKFRGESDIRTWLHRITVNVCLTRLRKSTNYEEERPDGEWSEDEDSDNGWETFASDGQSPEDLLIEKEIAGSVVEALELVSPDDMEILVLYYIEELTAEEIALVFKARINAVCNRLYRARKRLSAEAGAILKELMR